MRTLPIDANALNLLATGGVQPVAVWAELSDGSRRAVPDAQEKDEHGTPLWNVEALIPPANPTDRAEVIAVRVASWDQPQVAQFQPVHFRGLVVRCSVNKRTGALGQYWSAEGVADKAGKAAA